jgi:hypothetical protein
VVRAAVVHPAVVRAAVRVVAVVPAPSVRVPVFAGTAVAVGPASLVALVTLVIDREGAVVVARDHLGPVGSHGVGTDHGDDTHPRGNELVEGTGRGPRGHGPAECQQAGRGCGSDGNQGRQATHGKTP